MVALIGGHWDSEITLNENVGFDFLNSDMELSLDSLHLVLPICRFDL